MRQLAWRSGILAGALLSAAALSASGAGERPTTGADLLTRLERAADSGDARAGEALEAMEAFMAAHRLDPSALPIPDDTVSRETLAGATIEITDGAPWYIKVANVTAIGSRDALHAYRSSRNAALADMAWRDPEQAVEVMIAPARDLDIQSLAKILDCSCAGAIVVDVYEDSSWLMASGRSVDGHDISNGALEASLREQVGPSLDQFGLAAGDDIRFAVRSFRTTLSAADASRVAAEPDIYAVDPLSDLAAAHVGRAALIEVSAGPDLRELHARLAIGTAIDESAAVPAERGER